MGTITFSKIMQVIPKVLTDWRVLMAVAGVVFYLNFVAYVQHYRKKPPRVRIKSAPPKPAEKKDDAAGESGGSADAAAADTGKP